MDNTTKAIKSVSLLWLGSLLGSGSTFVIYMVLARKLGPEHFGLFSSSLALATVFTLLAGFGISQFWLKVFGKDGWNGLCWVSASLKFVYITVIIVFLLMLIWSYFGPHDKLNRYIIIILFFYILGQLSVDLVSSKLQLEENYIALALWQLLPNLTRLLIVAYVAYLTAYTLNPIDVAIIYSFVGVVFLVVGLFHISNFKKGAFKLKGHGAISWNRDCTYRVKNVFQECWPFGMASFLAFIYVQSTIIMVKYLCNDTEAGYYNIAFVILTSVMILPTVLYQKYFLPKYHRWAIHDRDKFYIAYRKGNFAMLLSGSILTVVLLIIADWLIVFLFGGGYGPSLAPTKILAFAVPIYFLSYSIGATLVTQEHMRVKVKLMCVVAMVNIILNLSLIPLYLSIGAAISTLFSNILLLILYYMTAQNKVFVRRECSKCGI
ncbi:oligosaccharide flippase family protein [Trichlorobacter lovleyi]|uniref:oligosaccharide flippase family protein n=1 Tax=Trichlorobacter lovleyi TaxID=313985 RepID=UPI00223EAFEE|nr:oligosaccharide flippase family protein [Trichlorobacter lovleyi]QOX78540.1 oligosaccharide flippase family protein [Trichlorobacter lovleyi]